MTHFLSADDPFPVAAGSESLFSPSTFDSALLDHSTLDDLPPPEPEPEPQPAQQPQSQPSLSTRKRARNSSSPSTSCSKKNPKARDLAEKLSSKDPNEVNDALNTLLKLSSDHDLNYALGRNGELVAKCLVTLYDETIGWKHGDSYLDKSEMNQNHDDEEEEDDLSDLTPSSKTWQNNASPSKVGNKPLDDSDFPTFCATKFAPTALNTAMTPSHINPSYILSDVNNKEHLKRLEIIIMIIRNLSFVQANARFLIHSVGIMRILTGSLYFRNFKTGRVERGAKIERDEIDVDAGNSGNNMCLHAIHAIYNLVPSIDVTGRKVYLDLLLLDGQLDVTQSQTKAAKSADSLDVKTLINAKKYGKINGYGLGAIYIARNFSIRDESFSKLFSKIPDKDIKPMVKKYIRAALTIFPPLVGLIKLTTSRPIVMAALDLMIILIDHEENHPIFEYISDEILYHMGRLLWKNRLGPDSLEYVDPIINMVTRVVSMKLIGTYDSNVDYELRDRAVEFLVKLTNLSPELKRRVGKKIVYTPTDDYGLSIATPTNVPNTKIYDALIPALTTKCGISQTPLLVAKLLQNLASVPENYCGILYLQRKMIKTVTTVGFENEQISDILLNQVLNKII